MERNDRNACISAIIEYLLAHKEEEGEWLHQCFIQTLMELFQLNFEDGFKKVPSLQVLARRALPF